MNPQVPMSPTSAHEALSRKREAEFIAAAARVFRAGFPNPERSGCPDKEALHSVARKTRDAAESEGVLEHLTCCSPCFAEYEHLLRKDRLSKNMKILALCASLLITVGLVIWFYGPLGQRGLRRTQPTIVQKVPSPPQSLPTQYEMAIIDLRNRSPVRGEQPPAPAEEVVASLPTRPLELSVYLPIGSEEGQYEVQILREVGTLFVTVGGSAVFEDRTLVLRLRADLTALNPGRYLLGVRKGNFRWTYYPISTQ